MRRESLAAGALLCVGVALAAVQATAFDGGVTTATLVRSGPMLAVAGAVVYGGAWLLRNGAPAGDADRILAWTLGGGVTVGAVVVLAAIGRAVPAVGALAVDGATGGVLAGLLVGLYDARGRARREEVESFARRVSALNQYGKALNNSATVDEVSALCVEAVEYLVAGDGAAFVLVDDGATGVSSVADEVSPETDGAPAETDGERDESSAGGTGGPAGEASATGDGIDEVDVTVVDSTLRGDDELRVLEALARDVDTDDDVEAVRYAETDVSLGAADPDAALVIPVPTPGGRALIVSLSTEAELAYGDDDVDLLETLAAHVSTALDHVAASGDRRALAGGDSRL
ncbi:hypothetical protein RYH80_05970 [Halobaculum sp. MBLA0147]|uniref:hypothetical protein n=1 Tax=Halobaculum sp. MBLA0147 TaxID=3079934 RepID=UPI0035239FCA